MAEFETRTVPASFQTREDPTTGAPILHGYAAVFNEQADLGPFRERILPGAFTRTLSMDPDVRFLVDHAGQPLARTKSGTLTLAEDEKGLRVQATLDPTDPDVQRLLPKMRRGDLDQMSFAFRVPKPHGESWSEGRTLRDVREAILHGGDVSVVTYPAYQSTSASVRGRDRREASYVFGERLLADHFREQRSISPASLAKLKEIVAEIEAGQDDDGADPEPDDTPGPPGRAGTEPVAVRSGMSLDLARRIATAL